MVKDETSKSLSLEIVLVISMKMDGETQLGPAHTQG